MSVVNKKGETTQRQQKVKYLTQLNQLNENLYNWKIFLRNISAMKECYTVYLLSTTIFFVAVIFYNITPIYLWNSPCLRHGLIWEIFTLSHIFFVKIQFCSIFHIKY